VVCDYSGWSQIILINLWFIPEIHEISSLLNFQLRKIFAIQVTHTKLAVLSAEIIMQLPL